jgi:hypothetical protein
MVWDGKLGDNGKTGLIGFPSEFDGREPATGAVRNKESPPSLDYSDI